VLGVDFCGNVSGIFSGLLAFAFDHASGSRGLSGWQWYETLVQNDEASHVNHQSQAISFRGNGYSGSGCGNLVPTP